MNITADDKRKCAGREAKMRRRVYPGLVEKNRMTQEQADREIATMEAIADDYAQSVDLEKPRLI